MKDKIKIAVIGSRAGYPKDPAEMIEELLKVENLNKNEIIIVSGGARGVDSIAESWARSNNVETLIFPADWKNLGKGAGYIRNVQIIDSADIVLAIWDGQSRGTRHSLYLSRRSGKKVYLVNPEFHLANQEELPESLNYKTNE